MAKNILSIPANQPFADTLAQFVLTQLVDKQNELALADITIYTPAPRLAASLKAAFRQAGCVICPNILPITAAEKPTNQIAKLTAWLTLNRQVSAFLPQSTQQRTMADALSLLNLIARLKSHQIPLNSLQQFIPKELAGHWQKIALFLDIVLKNYPQWLQEIGKIDSSDAQILHLTNLAQNIKQNGLNNITIAAGFSDTTPAAMQALQAIAASPNGYIILPPLNAEVKAELAPTHSHFSIAKLLAALNVSFSEVEFIPTLPTANSTALQQIIDGDSVATTNCDNLTLIEAPDSSSEALAIAMAMREVLENQHQTAALVSANRSLAKQVVAHLASFGVIVDDSAGEPLHTTLNGRFITLIANCWSNNFDPLSIAELISHPLCRGGLELGEWKQLVHTTCKRLHGATASNGLDGLRFQLKPDGRAGIEKLIEYFAPLTNLNRRQIKPAEGLQAILAVADNLSASNNDILWRAADHAETIITTIESLTEAAATLPAHSANDLAEVLNSVLEQEVVHASYHHPRLFIWGPLEARLQKADRLILADLNEGGWPRKQTPDPWLNRAMQQAIGLGNPDAIVGLSAHDFISLISSANEVFLTRATANDAGETVPSRFITRLQVALPNALPQLQKRGQVWVNRAAKYRRLGNNLSAATAAVAMPNKLDRPSKWSASMVKDLMNCPYKVYLNKTLGLRKLEPFNAAADARDRGQLIHTCLQAFFTQVERLPQPFAEPVTKHNQAAAIDHLLHIGEVVFKQLQQPTVKAVWWPRFVKIAEDFISTMANLETGRTPTIFEFDGEIKFDGITLHAIADRVDKTANGLIILDYKTGAPASQTNVKLGLDPQLAIEGFLVKRGAFGEPNLAGLEFWKLSSSGEKAVEISALKNLDELVENAEAGLQLLIDTYIKNEAPMAAVPANFAEVSGHCQYCDFSGICRFKVWEQPHA